MWQGLALVFLILFCVDTSLSSVVAEYISEAVDDINRKVGKLESGNELPLIAFAVSVAQARLEVACPWRSP